MKLLIGIATYRRIEKLKRLLSSLYTQTHQDFDILVACDNNDMETKKALSPIYHQIPFIIMEEQNYVIGCWNRLHGLRNIPDSPFDNPVVRYDAHLMLCDDVELFPNCLELAILDLKKYFPTSDGVVGITQECPGRPDYTYKPFGQTLIGGKFIDRYSKVGYKVCCPFYTHFFQDEELYQYALSMGKFYHSPNAKLYHYHPSFKPDEMDSTHKIARNPSLFNRDGEIFRRRQAAGRLWGRGWEE